MLIVELETVLVVLLIVKTSLQCAAETNKTHMSDPYRWQQDYLNPGLSNPTKSTALTNELQPGLHWQAKTEIQSDILLSANLQSISDAQAEPVAYIGIVVEQ